jgi:hypothetical protein
MMQQISQVSQIFRNFRLAADRYRCTIQLAPQFSELSIPTIKQGARLAVGGVVMVDERGKFRELILKPSMIDRLRRTRPLSGRISGTPL